jgi:alkaline phosphatase
LKNRIYSQRLFIFVCLLFLLLATNQAYSGQGATKYFFLLIGDGMGPTQIDTAARYHLSKNLKKTDSSLRPLELTLLSYSGITTTHSANRAVTGSSAASTAIATGQKTNNGVLSMSPDNTKKYKTIAEIAKEKAMKVGIVTSVWIDHATPASFYAHQPSRNNHSQITNELINSNFDYFGGGASNALIHFDEKAYNKFISLAKKNDYRVINDVAQIKSNISFDGKLWAFRKNNIISYEIDGDSENPTLKDYTRLGVKQLFNDEGFFMMIEGGMIDWACHANDAASSIKNIIAFDQVLKVVLDFYYKHPNETLVVVTSDHETGGMKLDESKVGLDKFAGIIDCQKQSNSVFVEILEKESNENLTIDKAKQFAAKYYGLTNLTDSEEKKLLAVINGGDESKSKYNYGGDGALSMTYSRVLAARAGITWTTTDHTATPVRTMAIGAGAEKFQGVYDNVDIFKKILSIME